MTYLFLGCRALLLVVFLAAVAGKARGRAAFAEFASSVVALRLLPRKASRAAAAAVVGTEAAAAVLLAFPATALAGFVVAIGLLVAFVTGIVMALRGGRAVPCRCFGASATPLGPVHVVRNLALTAVGLAGLAAGLTSSAWPAHAGGVAVTAATAAIGALILIRFDDLAFLFTDPKRDSPS
ncbi:MauE/DoxX family redox-associated membrane protein [Streptomyces sp. AC550_RSS872]|uniref:MauE/DoxX family redox-associated membrane protein n=1 Tax=Streptomyces sp. AC550_RSS872 TaxID=2823689 RepID=UPI001C25475E|nr:MauE/DoxX family redox-associated membrane protein [Streptomyces sp. AC550_RSS872]